MSAFFNPHAKNSLRHMTELHHAREVCPSDKTAPRRWSPVLPPELPRALPQAAPNPRSRRRARSNRQAAQFAACMASYNENAVGPMGLRDHGRARRPNRTRSTTSGSGGQVASERQVRRREAWEDRDARRITQCPGPRLIVDRVPTHIPKWSVPLDGCRSCQIGSGCVDAFLNRRCWRG